MSSQTNFAERYRVMSETELMNLARAYDDLVDAAQAALRAEFARRGLEPPLVEEEEGPLPDDEAGPVTVGQYRDLPEALVSRAVLEQAGIQSFLSDENTVRTNWTLSNAVGGIRLQVAAKDEAEAREVLSQPALHQFATDSGVDFVQPVCPKCGSTDVMANDHERKVLAGSIPVSIPLPHREASGAEWRCLQCDAVWVDDEELEERDGTLR
jgi:ribosomal protein S27AE